MELRHHHQPRRFLENLELGVSRGTFVPWTEIHTSLHWNVQRTEVNDVPSERSTTPGNPYSEYYTQNVFETGQIFRHTEAQ